MNEESIKKSLTVFGVAFMLAFTFIPLLYMMVVSFTMSPDFFLLSSSVKLTVVNYVDILTNRSLHFLHYLRNSIVVAGLTALISVVVASFGAYSVTRLPLPGKTLIILTVLAISMFPQVSSSGYLFKFMTSLGLINTYTSLVLPYTSWILPLTLWILISYFSQIPKDLDKAALVDGCSRWKILLKVIFPVAVPGILSTLLLAFIFAFNEFLFALMLTTNFRARTVPVGIALFQGLHGEIPWGNIMAASTVSTIPVIALTILFQHRIISGLTRGAVKG